MADRPADLPDRAPTSRQDWDVVLVEPHLHDLVVGYLVEHSRRPLKAVRLWSKLLTLLSGEGNEIPASREEIARMVGCRPRDVSEIMGELEMIAVVERRRDGRAVRYFLNPKLAMHAAIMVRGLA